MIASPHISKHAVSRVKDKVPVPTRCRYCGSDVTLVDNKIIYGKSFHSWPYAYLCQGKGCGAYVGVHPNTAVPLGTLADKPLRMARKRTKGRFIALMKEKSWPRKRAYAWLASQLHIPVRDCHFGWFEKDMLDKVATAVLKESSGWLSDFNLRD